MVRMLSLWLLLAGQFAAKRSPTTLVWRPRAIPFVAVKIIAARDDKSSAKDHFLAEPRSFDAVFDDSDPGSRLTDGSFSQLARRWWSMVASYLRSS